jgi:gamma-glutamylcyclotransferase (GGCT)/AIG2-like uncharacterized protein YtfP
MDSSRLPLFTFGTLRRGEVNHHYLAEKFVDVVPAWLDGYVRLHPLMIAEQAGGVVDGELFTLDPQTYDEALAGCDDLEGLKDGQLIGADYERRQVTVRTAQGLVRAWAYVQPPAGG